MRNMNLFLPYFNSFYEFKTMNPILLPVILLSRNIPLHDILDSLLALFYKTNSNIVSNSNIIHAKERVNCITL